MISRIQPLTDDVIDQIAAGEVLERPAHMVKELIENSLDAGATSLEVHVKNGGRDVKIKDNGRGILAEDLEIALLRHTTSKLSKMKDLWTLNTFGFRGEALASIASVSHLTLRSRANGHSAYEIQSHFGKIQKKTESQHEVGTTLEIQGLLDNVPARKKFLKTDAYEVSEIRKVIYAYGLSSPKTEIKFFYNDKLEFIWPSGSPLLSRFKDILKTQDLYESVADYGGVRVRAYFAPPHETAKSTRKIWLFVQNRWVQEPSLLAAVRDGFQNALLPGESPIGAVFVDVPPEEIDVNVHPTKSRVKFQDPSSIYRAVRNTLLDLVERSPWRQDFLMPQTEEQDELQSPQHEYQKPATETSYKQEEFGLAAYRSTPYAQKRQNSDGGGAIDERGAPLGWPSSVTMTSAAPKRTHLDAVGESDTPKWTHLKVVGQVAKTYIVTQNQTEMVLIDQHAAHERFLFEKLWTAFKEGRALETQNHLIPLSYALESEAFMELLLAEKSNIEKFGIAFEQSGPTQIEIVATPLMFKDSSIVKTLDVMMEQMAKHGTSFIFEDVLADMFATMACHSAIRAGQILSVPEMEALLDAMDEFPTTSYCPHGRPVFVRYPFTKLETDFFRRV
ncbi:MAG: DNA mismatch repair endonuclease MutL [Bdellovibrionaceae bacterium]|nr:DNA mismatch repair endonuclease MutL [Pseudobdellovibrionaceae bacterium]